MSKANNNRLSYVKKPTLEESFIFRLLWFSTLSLLFEAVLIGGFIFFHFQSTKQHASLYIILIVLVISLIISVSVRATYEEPFNIFYIPLPFITVLLNIFLLDRNFLIESRAFFFAVATYIAAHTLFEYFNFTAGEIRKTILFHAHQVLKFTTSIVCMIIFPQIIHLETWTVQIESLNYTLSSLVIYGVLLLVVIMLFGPIMFITLLIFRSSQLFRISKTLRRISSWSLDHQVIDQRLQNEVHSPQLTHKTILSGDIRGFTNYSIDHDVLIVSNVLKGFYTIIEETVKRYHGFKPEFIADEFITFFNNPFNALDCAIHLQKQFKTYFKDHNLGVGIGVNSGMVLEGLIGTRYSKKYTFLGDPVNITVKLQKNADKGAILVTEKLKNDIETRYRFSLVKKHYPEIPHVKNNYIVIGRAQRQKEKSKSLLLDLKEKVL